MIKRFLFKIKGYNSLLESKVKTLIAARDYNEAFEIGESLVGIGGWIISIKDTDKEVVIKEGDNEND